MTVRRLGLATGALVAATLVGCGQGGGHSSPDLARLPLVAGAQIVVQAKECDSGSTAYCAVELVIADPMYKTSEDLLKGEHDRLRAAGWSGANADTGEEHAADSPGRKLRLTYATAFGDLLGVDKHWIQRPRTIQLALSHALFDRSPALSLMLEQGVS